VSKRSGSTSERSGSSTDRRVAIATLLAVTIAFGAGWGVVAAQGLVGGLDDRLNDWLFRLRYALQGPQPMDVSIVTVDFTDEAEPELAARAGDRSVYARLMDSLSSAGAASIVFDIVLLGSGSPEVDRQRAEAARRAGNVLSPVAIRRDGLRITSSPSLASASRGLGHINVVADPDGVRRRVELRLRSADGWIPSLALLAACDALGVDPSSIEVVPGWRVRIPGARLRDGSVCDVDIPVDGRDRMIVNWVGPWNDSFPHYSPVTLLDAIDDPTLAEELRAQLEGARVIVGDLTTPGGDQGPTPFAASYPLPGLHANALNSILTARFLRSQRWYESLFLSLAFAALLWVCFWKLLPAVATAAALAAGLAIAGLQFALFLGPGIMPRLAAPALGLALAAIGANAWRYLNAERERIAVRLKLERYFAPQLMTKLLRSEDLLVRAQQKTLTVLFSDIAGFTAWSQGQQPSAVHATLNEYFEEMTDIVFAHEGTVDKFIGDGLMAFFGDPIEQPDHALRAVHTAVDMQLAARRLRAAWEPAGRLPLEIRIGINTGEVIVGDMGSSRITAYTAIGPAVNLAQRLEANAPVGGILVSEPVWRDAGPEIPMRSRGRITAKGIAEAFETWEVQLPAPGSGSSTRVK
jgi:adenylate cyclase